MENGAEALKIAFAILMFLVALSLSISSFSEATNAIDSITTQRDRETEYTYVQPTENLSRVVGIETVITSLYRITEQNLEIHFYEKSASGSETKMELFKLLNVNGSDTGETSNYIDLAHENLTFGGQFLPNEFIDILIGGRNIKNWNEIKSKYVNRLIDGELEEGLYKRYANNKFEERLGEYEQGEGAAKITKRVITYVKLP